MDNFEPSNSNLSELKSNADGSVWGSLITSVVDLGSAALKDNAQKKANQKAQDEANNRAAEEKKKTDAQNALNAKNNKGVKQPPSSKSFFASPIGISLIVVGVLGVLVTVVILVKKKTAIAVKS